VSLVLLEISYTVHPVISCVHETVAD